MTRSAFVVLIILLVVGTAAAAVRFIGAGRATAAPLQTAIAAERELAPRVTATGSIRLAAGARVAVGARVSGVVQRLTVTQGSRVSRGDVIAQLDPREFAARLAQAEARAAEREAERTRAAASLARLEALYQVTAVSEEEIVDARAALDAAEARLAVAQAERDLARIQVDYTTVRAPISGVVASVSTQEGETVAASFAAPTFVTIIDLNRLECVALVDESDIGRVRVGQQAEFTVDTYPGRIFTGEVVYVAPDATILAGVVNYDVRIRVLEGVSDLKPEMTANVTISGESRRTLVVPSAAVRQGAQGTYVWRVRGSAPQRVAVRPGLRRIDFTEIQSGLSAGDTLLVSGFPEQR